jgi:transketolase
MDSTTKLAQEIRISSLQMVHKAGASHIGSAFSSVDLLAVLYGKILKYNSQEPEWSQRDRFILSKGHAASVIYATLAAMGYFPKEWLGTYSQSGSNLLGHVSHHVPGVELSTGSLGHGLPVGVGMALAGRQEKSEYRVFVLLSDGELDEGSNWEAFLFAAHHQLENLIAIVDYNKIQSYGLVQDVLGLEPLNQKLTSFGWAVEEINGHNHLEILNVLKNLPLKRKIPTIIIAHTIKGKGVSYMENQLAWHYKCPNEEQYNRALEELENT